MNVKHTFDLYMFATGNSRLSSSYSRLYVCLHYQLMTLVTNDIHLLYKHQSIIQSLNESCYVTATIAEYICNGQGLWEHHG